MKPPKLFAFFTIVFFVGISAGYFLSKYFSKTNDNSKIFEYTITAEPNSRFNFKSPDGQMLFGASLNTNNDLSEISFYKNNKTTFVTFFENMRPSKIEVFFEKRKVQGFGFFENGKIKYKSTFEDPKKEPNVELRQYFDENGNETIKKGISNICVD